jgi:hypothetical protein
MFEWLIGREHEDGNFYGEVTGFNVNTNKLIIKGVEVINDDEILKNIEMDLYTSYFQQNIDWYENYEEKLYNTLIKNGKAIVHIFSTEDNSGDSWFLEIYRLKTEVPTDISYEKLTIINYFISFCNEVKGEILTVQEGEKEKSAFERWINEQIESVSEFNHDGYRNTFTSIVMSDAFSSREELKYAYDLFGEEKLGLKKAAI